MAPLIVVTLKTEKKKKTQIKLRESSFLTNPQIVANLDVVPFGVMHIVLIDTQLGAGQRDASHLVLQRSDFKVAGNNVMQQKLMESWRE